MSDERCIAIADDILAGSLRVIGSIEDTLDFSTPAAIDWDAQVSASPSTFQLYLQCLNPVAFLTQAYRLTQDERYLGSAEEILKSWMDYVQSCQADRNTYAWYDHGVALRTENIIYFILTAEDLDLEFSRELKALLMEHGRWLYEDGNYFYQHNHGIFEDIALIYLSYFLKDEPETETWLSHAKQRLLEQLDYAFSEEMVHVENSPGYAIGVIELFQKGADFLYAQNDPDEAVLRQNLALARDYVSWATKPNGFLAMYGDTFGGSLKGTIQSPPADLQVGSAFYPKSGYYYYRDGVDRQSIWTSVRGGYSSKTHKHADDGSFQLYALGQDIFVDSGMYNYMTGNTYRDHMVSSSAHNTVVVDGKSYSVTAENSGNTGMLRTAQTDDYDYVLTFLDMYDGVDIDRHFYNFGDMIILYDDIRSEEEHRYEQLFQLYPGIEIVEQRDDEVLLRLGDRVHHVRVRQLGQQPTLEIKTGYYSEEMNDVVENQVLSFSSYSETAEYVTVITIEDQDGTLLYGSAPVVTYDAEERRIWIGEKAIDLQPRERASVDAIAMTIENDVVSVENLKQMEGNSYAWYLIDYETGKAIEKTGYSYDAAQGFVLKDRTAKYLIKAYVRSPEGYRRSAIVKMLEYADNRWQDVTKDYPDLELNYLGHKYREIGDGVYRFEVDYRYSWKSSIAWYIYRNGGGYDYVQTDGSPLEYRFTGPGIYDVMYYIRTLNGDNLFYNFEEIEIS